MGCKKGCGEAHTDGETQETLDSLEVWGAAQVKDFLVFLELIEVIGLTKADIEYWIVTQEDKEKVENDQIHAIMREMSAFMSTKAACPECGALLSALHVNTSPCNRIGGKYKYLLQCINPISCGWERAITITLRDFMIERKRRKIARFKEQNSGRKEKRDG